MTKRHFIALADTIREYNRIMEQGNYVNRFGSIQLDTLADFCQSQNPRFNRQRWLDYIAGTCGPNGGAVKKAVQS